MPINAFNTQLSISDPNKPIIEEVRLDDERPVTSFILSWKSDAKCQEFEMCVEGKNQKKLYEKIPNSDSGTMHCHHFTWPHAGDKCEVKLRNISNQLVGQWSKEKVVYLRKLNHLFSLMF